MSDDTRGSMTRTQRVLAQRVDAAVWGLLFIWMGVAVLTSIGWAVVLLGVGVIMLGGQVARESTRLPVNGFGIVVGALFFLGGVWNLLGLRLGKAAIPAFLPILCIVAGSLLVASALQPRVVR